MVGETAIILAVLDALPVILEKAPAVGLSIHNLFTSHAGELPADAQARLADVKVRQAVADAEWAADLPAADPAAVPDHPADDLAATVQQQAAELLRLNNELAAARQAGYGTGGGVPVRVTGGDEDTAAGGPNVEGVPPAPQPA